MPKAYSYIRMSTPEQANGDSIRRQLEASQRYIRQKGLEPAELFNDVGVSAFTGKNAAYGRLGDFLTLAKQGEIESGSYLIVESLDRLSRQAGMSSLTLIDDIIKCGIIVVTLEDGQEYSLASLQEKPQALMFALFSLMRAHDESRMKSVRVGAAWKNKRDLARNGVQTRQRIPTWLRFSASGAIEPIPERVELVQKIYEWSRDGWGTFSLARKLNAEGYEPWGRAKFWRETSLGKLLRNRAVLGEYQPHHHVDGKRIPEGSVIKGYYPTIIDIPLFEDVQQATAQRLVSGRGRKGKELSNLFSGLMKCPVCKVGMKFIDKGPPKGHTYLRCSAAALAASCSSVSIPYPEAELHILRTLRNINFEAVLKGDDWLLRTNELRKKIKDAEEKISSVNDRIDRAVSFIIQHDDPSTRLAETLKQDEIEVAHLTTELEKMKSELAGMNSASGLESSDLIDAIRDESLSGENRHALRRKLSEEIKRLVKAIYLQPDDFMPSSGQSDEEWQHGFVMQVVYRNGAVQRFDPASGDNFLFEESPKMQFFREANRLDAKHEKSSTTK